jgi:hypothetical protein
MAALYALLLIVVLTASGCVTTTKLSVGNLATSASTPVIDMRPASESTRENFSLIITSERYGYFRLAQDLTEPTGARLFTHRLQMKFGNSTVPPTSLLHFVVYGNSRTELKRFAAITAMGENIGGAFSNAKENRQGNAMNSLVDEATFNARSGDAEFKRAIYDSSKTAPTNSALIIYIQTESQGVRHFTRTVWPIKKSKSEESPLPGALEAAIAFHLEQ